jgi:chitinase
MIKGEYLTDLFIAFALIDEADGSSLYIREAGPCADGSPGFSIWDEVAALKEKYSHLKVNISVGGWGADGFSDMAAEPALRSAFTANACDWIEKYNLDGVDIDWEYPVGPKGGQEIKSRPEDRQNWITLLKDLRNAIDTLSEKTGKGYSLTTCVPASKWFINANDVVAAVKIVDALQIMAYDYYGGWNSTTGHNANLYDNPDDPRGAWSTDNALDQYLKAGVPSEKITVGAAFYGRAFEGVDPGPNGDGLFQPYKSISSKKGLGDRYSIKELLKPGSGYTRYWDKTAKAPYLYNGDIWISYTDEEQIQLLTAYAKEKKLAGVFYWEYAHDMDAELLKILVENSR